MSGRLFQAAEHMAKLMPLPLTVFCFSKIQFGFTFLVPAHLGSPGKKGPLNGCVCVFVCVCVCVCTCTRAHAIVIIITVIVINCIKARHYV